MTTTTETARPGFVGRLRSRQAGHPSGLLGRIVGRLMVTDTADTNDRALAKLDLTQPRTVLDVGFGQGRTVAVLVRAGHRVLGVDPSPTMVKQATARNRAACRDGRATLRHGDGITIPFPDDSADAAITAVAVGPRARRHDQRRRHPLAGGSGRELISRGWRRPGQGRHIPTPAPRCSSDRRSAQLEAHHGRGG